MTKILNWIYLRIAPGRIVKKMTNSISRRAFFIMEYQEMYRRIWRAEFAQAKLKEIREGIRREFDKNNEDLNAIEASLDKKPKKEVEEALIKAKESKKKDLEQFKKQVDELDAQITDTDKLLTGYNEGLKLLSDFIKE